MSLSVANQMRNVLGTSLFIYLAFAVSCGAAQLSPIRNDVDPQEILKQLVPEVPGLTLVPQKDLEPNPPGRYHRSAFIRGDFNRDGTEEIALSATDDWVRKGITLSRNGYVLIARKKANGDWTRVFLHKLPFTAYPFMIWDKERMSLVVGANKSDSHPGEIVWNQSKKEYELVKFK